MSTVKDLDRLLQGFVDGGLPGCSLQIAQRGKTLYEGYFGYADIEAKTPVTARSIFRQASMSKIPLYVTMMMLYERGKFLLTDPIYNFFPEWREMKKYVKHANGYVNAVPTDGPITVSDVLSMKCGLPYCNSAAPTDNRTLQSMQAAMKPLWEKGHYTNREQIAAISNAVLACEPGTEWIYGFSSELAAGIIEAVCGKPIDDAFEELLFAPLGMDDTRSHFFGDSKERMVKLYRRTDEGALVPGPAFFDKKHLPGAENEEGWARLFLKRQRLYKAHANAGKWRRLQWTAHHGTQNHRHDACKRHHRHDACKRPRPALHGYIQRRVRLWLRRTHAR